MVSNGITYLDSRLDFWRQQQPLYSRKKKRIDVGNRNRLIKGYPFSREYTFNTFATEQILTESSVVTNNAANNPSPAVV